MAMFRELNFKKVTDKLARLKVELPKTLANMAQNYFSDAFRKEAWDGKKWKEVQRRISGTNAWKYPKKKGLQRRKRGILQGATRQLYKSITHSIRSAKWDDIRLGTPIEYAEYQNEGTKHIDPRKFMGESNELQKAMKKEITLQLGKMLKQ